MNPFEQLGTGWPKQWANYRRYIKKLYRRAVRREAKKYLDDAPPKHYKGYAD